MIAVEDTGNITFSSGDHTERISGLNSLVQELLIELLSDFDSRTGRGCNLIKDITNISIQEPATIGPIAAQATQTARAHIISNQSKALNLLPSERLADLELLSANMTNDKFAIELKLTNLENQSTVVQVPL